MTYSGLPAMRSGVALQMTYRGLPTMRSGELEDDQQRAANDE